jgi:reactive intermediate/imine deaminase
MSGSSGAAPARAISTPEAPPPVGAYSQAIVAGDFVFISGQTPRTPSGVRLLDASFEEQTEQVLDNIERIAAAAGTSLADAVNVTVFLVDPSHAAAFDAVYRERVSAPPPARAIVQSSLLTGGLEVTATLYRPSSGETAGTP